MPSTMPEVFLVPDSLLGSCKAPTGLPLLSLLTSGQQPTLTQTWGPPPPLLPSPSPPLPVLPFRLLNSAGAPTLIMLELLMLEHLIVPRICRLLAFHSTPARSPAPSLGSHLPKPSTSLYSKEPDCLLRG